MEKVTGGAGDDTVTGNSAANTLFGGAGIDVLDGGPGNDNLDGGDGADTFIGGTGTDAATYAGRAAAVQVDIDDVADDGGVLDGNADNVRLTVERLTGGNGGDTLRGSAAVNLIMGGPGADTMFGEGGNDQMKALDGAADDISCGSGTDTLDRDAGLDVFLVAGAEACETLTP